MRFRYDSRQTCVSQALGANNPTMSYETREEDLTDLELEDPVMNAKKAAKWAGVCDGTIFFMSNPEDRGIAREMALSHGPSRKAA